MYHNEGAAGAERLVSLAFADGEVRDFTGERSAEKLWAILSFFHQRYTLSLFESLPPARVGGKKSVRCGGLPSPALGPLAPTPVGAPRPWGARIKLRPRIKYAEDGY